uniref:SUN domain-containing protein 3-like n=1 Tax=Scatophagus argus TaxID=75038 RepID=UPI001ED84FC5|nr:SUN domain-containing protein 3-like [Scatophagus argus]
MTRRSARLESMGYYDSEGNPTISYKETVFKIFKRRKNHFWHERGESTQTLIDNENTGDNLNGNSNNYSRRPKMFIRKIFDIFLFIFPLCFGLAYVIPTLSCSFLDLGVPYSPVSPTYINMELNVGNEDQMKHLINMEEELLRLQKHVNDLRNMEEELLRLQKHVTHLRNMEEELLRLKKQMNDLSPDVDAWPDFALDSQGAVALPQKSSETYRTKEASFTFFGIPISLPVKPKIVLQRQKPLTPGHCWAFAGGRGHLFIALSNPIFISHVTLGHISKNVSPTGKISSAPKHFSVYGLETLDDDGTKLGTFLYDHDGDSLQTFKLRLPSSHKERVIRYVRLQVESNWGHPDYTCLYNFRVHGKLAE